ASRYSFYYDLTNIVMTLLWMIGILLMGGAACWLLAGRSILLSKWVALLAVVADLGIVCRLAVKYWGLAGVHDAWLIDYHSGWIPSFGIGFHVALDGLSLVLLLLTFFLGTLAVLCSWEEIKQRTGFYFFNLLWTLAGISGVFIA